MSLSKLLTSGLCAFALLLISHSVTAQVQYTLKDNEFLFIDGEEYREIAIEVSSDRSKLYVNGFLYVEARDSISPRSAGLPGLIGVAAKRERCARLPIVRQWIEGGEDESVAVERYMTLTSNLFLAVHDVAKRVRAGVLDYAAGRSEIESLLSEGLNKELVNDVELHRGGSFTWGPRSGIGSTVAMVETDAETRLRKEREANVVEVKYDRVRELFRQTNSPELVMLLEGGGMYYKSGPLVFSAYEQLRAILDSGTYVEGPISRVVIQNGRFIKKSE